MRILPNPPPGDLIIDAAENLIIPAASVQTFHNDLNALASIWAGLELLYIQTRRAEKRYVPNVPEGFVSQTWGGIPGIPLQTRQQLTCFFDWYSVTACNYVAMTGWLASACNVSAESWQKYRRRVIPVVLAHRHKIGAHASRFDPKNDGIALQEASNFRQLALRNDRFLANTMVFTRTVGGETTDSSELGAWSLTETHEQLRLRYTLPGQPDQPPDAIVEE